MKITFLGTGPSLGTPIISCNCEVCKSTDKRDNRLRSSIMIEIEGKTIIIDAHTDTEIILQDWMTFVHLILFRTKLSEYMQKIM